MAVDLMKEFAHVKINLAKRESIEEADALAKLGASTKNKKEDKWI